MKALKPIIIEGVEIGSRLFLGTGKFASANDLQNAVEQSDTELITVALRRVDLKNPNDMILSTLAKFVDQGSLRLLPNTSGARNAQEAIRLAKLARAALGTTWLKLEVTPEPNWLLPDPIETFAAARELTALGFSVFPYINADALLAKRLEEIGCPVVMPLGSPIGSNRGLNTRAQLEMIFDLSNIPVVVDAGLGAPSHAAEAIELGADAVLVNTAIATAGDPGKMALAFNLAVKSAICARTAELPAKKAQATASSPLTGFLQEA